MTHDDETMRGRRSLVSLHKIPAVFHFRDTPCVWCKHVIHHSLVSYKVCCNSVNHRFAPTLDKILDGFYFSLFNIILQLETLNVFKENVKMILK